MLLQVSLLWPSGLKTREKILTLYNDDFFARRAHHVKADILFAFNWKTTTGARLAVELESVVTGTLELQYKLRRSPTYLVVARESHRTSKSYLPSSKIA